MVISEGSGTFYAAPRIKVGTRLFNGDTDNLYWIVGRLEGGNEWRGPFATLAIADTAGVAFLNKYTVPGLNLETFVRVEVGKRYWLQDNRTWFMRTEKAYTQVRALPADEPGPDPTPTPPPVTARFGFIHDESSFPTKGRYTVTTNGSLGNFFTHNNNLFGYVPPDKNGLNGGYQIMPESAIDANKIYWLPPSSFGFNAATIAAGNNCIVGPVHLQDGYQYSNKALTRQNSVGQIQIIVDRPVTDIPTDDGTDGYSLAGYTVGWGSVVRFVRALSRTYEYQVPTITDWNVTTSGDLSLNQAVAAGGTNIFHFDSVETVIIAPVGRTPWGPYGSSYTGPSAGSVVPAGMSPVDDAIFPEPGTTAEYKISDLSCYCIVDYIIRAAYVNRVDGIATYSYSDPITEKVCIFPYPSEPPLTYCTSITAPQYPPGQSHEGVNGGNGTMTFDWYADSPKMATQPRPVQFNWSDVPNDGGYTVVENWGYHYDVYTHAFKPTTDKTWWTGVSDATGNYHVTQIWGQITPIKNQYGAPQWGGLTLHGLVFPKVLPFGNGGSCPYPMPRRDAISELDLGMPCAGMSGQGEVQAAGNYYTIDYYTPPTISFGPLPAKVVYRYWTGRAGIWIVDPGQQPPPYDNGSSAYIATLLDGRKAYWYLGDQGGQAQPGHGVIGWGYAFPGSGLTITYTRPYYASGPYYFFINSDTNTPADPQSPRDYIPATGDVIDPTGAAGFITVPTAGTDPATGLSNFEVVYLYTTPQKKSIA